MQHHICPKNLNYYNSQMHLLKCRHHWNMVCYRLPLRMHLLNMPESMINQKERFSLLFHLLFDHLFLYLYLLSWYSRKQHHILHSSLRLCHIHLLMLQHKVLLLILRHMPLLPSVVSYYHIDVFLLFHPLLCIFHCDMLNQIKHISPPLY